MVEEDVAFADVDDNGGVFVQMRDGDKSSLAPCGRQCQELLAIKLRLRRGDDVLKMIPKLIETVEATNKQIATMTEQLAQTSDIVAAWNNVKGFNKTMGFISNFIKVSAPIVAGIGILWLMFHAPLEAINQIKQSAVNK